MARVRTAWAIATVVSLTLLLRPPLAVIGPLLAQIQPDLHLSSAQTGLLTSIPVLCFGAGAFAGPRLLRRFGLANSFIGILVLLIVSISTRVWFGFDYLVIATILMGLGIASSNVLFPALILAEFPNSVPKMTAFYTTLLSSFAAVAAGVAVPLAAALGGWRALLTALAVPGVIGLIAWLVTIRLTHPTARVLDNAGERPKLWRHRLAWSLAGFFGLQSANFYVLLNWLPTYLISEGMSAQEAGLALAFMTFIGIPAGLVMTANLKRLKPYSTQLVVGISLITAAGVFLLLAGLHWVWLACALISCGLSTSFPLSLALIGIKGGSQSVTTGLSAIAQGIGYLAAALFVFLAGTAADAFGSWTPVLVVLAVSALLQMLPGSHAAKHPTIGK